MQKIIITFQTTTMAMFMERTCKNAGKNGRLIPLPKQISAGCGLAWMTEDYDIENWHIFLDEKGVRYSEMVEMEI